MGLGGHGGGGGWGPDGGLDHTEGEDYQQDKELTGIVCFVATAAYDSPLAEDINRFRKFRDDYLVGNALGEAFLETYYGGLGEAAAEYLEEHESVKETVRGFLEGTAEFLEVLQDDWQPEEYEPSPDWEELRAELE